MIQTTPAIGTTMAVEQIDPTKASAYLETSGENRRTRTGKIDQYARDMTAGNWHSSVLRFDRDGKLVDGQHRLWAVVVSGSSQVFYVERGVSPEAIRTIDSGLVRTGGDVLSIMGEANATTLASAIRYARWFEKNPGFAPSSQTRDPFSPDELVAYLRDNPGIRDSVRISKRMFGVVPYSSSLAGGLHFLEAKRDLAKANEFWSQMLSGAEMREGTGPYMLRKAVIADRLKIREERMNINVIAALSIKAWNAWERGREIRILRWARGPQFNEAFPTIGVINE